MEAQVEVGESDLIGNDGDPLVQVTDDAVVDETNELIEDSDDSFVLAKDDIAADDVNEQSGEISVTVERENQHLVLLK